MEYLKSPMLFHLHHFLHITNNTSMVITQHISYNFNLLNSCPINDLQLSIKTEISADTANL